MEMATPPGERSDIIIFGAGKLPEIGSGIGKGIKNFKNATSGKPEEISSPDDKKASRKTATPNHPGDPAHQISLQSHPPTLCANHQQSKLGNQNKIL